MWPVENPLEKVSSDRFPEIWREDAENLFFQDEGELSENREYRIFPAARGIGRQAGQAERRLEQPVRLRQFEGLRMGQLGKRVTRTLNDFVPDLEKWKYPHQTDFLMILSG